MGRGVRLDRRDRAAAPDRATQANWFLEELSIAAAVTRLKVEHRLIASVLACPRIGILRCEERGVGAHLFDRFDFALMFLAAQMRHRHDPNDDRATQLAVLSMARFALKQYGFWDETAVAHERGMAWSEKNLVRLACVDGDVRDACFWAEELARIVKNQERARRHWRAMVELLKDCCATKGGDAPRQ